MLLLMIAGETFTPRFEQGSPWQVRETSRGQAISVRSDSGRFDEIATIDHTVGCLRMGLIWKVYLEFWMKILSSEFPAKLYIFLELVVNEWISLLVDGGCRDPKDSSDYHDHFDGLKTHQVK